MSGQEGKTGPTADIVKALIILARHGVPPDVQALIVHGDASQGVPPGALQAVLKACATDVAGNRQGER